MTGITTGVGSPRTVSAASGGRTYAFNNISTSPQQVVGQNSQRQNITIHNPGTVDIFFAPTTVISAGAEVPLTPSLGALGGCYLILAGGTLKVDGECQKPWQAFARSGTTNALTITDSNV